MIAQRFRPVAWVAGVATAVTMLYMISAQVAAERGRLEAINQKMADTRDEIRQLQTELGTRASLRQLERWNSEVLALTSPTARQYVDGENGISSISSANLGKEGVAPPPVMAAILVRPATPKDTESAGVEPTKKLTEQDHMVQRAIAAATPEKPLVSSARLIKPDKSDSVPSRVASAKPVTTSERKLADIMKSVKPEVHSGDSQ